MYFSPICLVWHICPIGQIIIDSEKDDTDALIE
jgi:hypothetical protein